MGICVTREQQKKYKSAQREQTQAEEREQAAVQQLERTEQELAKLKQQAAERRERAGVELYGVFESVDRMWGTLSTDGNDAITGEELEAALERHPDVRAQLSAELGNLSSKEASSRVVELLCADAQGKVTRDSFFAQLVIESHVGTYFAAVSDEEQGISREEFTKMMNNPDNAPLRALIKMRVPSQGVAGPEYVFHYIDTNNDQRISLHEFMFALHRNERATSVFQRLDADGNGYISNKELKAALGGTEGDALLSLFKHENQELSAETLFATLDADGDGKISLPEFLERLVHGHETQL
eukprot:TRINITY_DN16899_c0_g1_i3.p1 TRINITY_DN16899_c0_g1~~TRINITY_DN16899_c0_g1_i3.p1  ORF type:complete len:298 (-),score=76.68 TRINITY_DN16899_c0_g1_i3:87-980(-)